jgi:hypothetical protein
MLLVIGIMGLQYRLNAGLRHAAEKIGVWQRVLELACLESVSPMPCTKSLMPGRTESLTPFTAVTICSYPATMLSIIEIRLPL